MRPCHVVSLLSVFLNLAAAAEIRFTEQLISADFTYPYGLMAADLDGDGDIDLTASDARGRNSMHWFENDGTGRFTRHLMHYQAPPAYRLERHQIADVNRDGRPDVVVVENSSGDLRWLENPGPDSIRGEWTPHFIALSSNVPGAYDVDVGDLDADGWPDVVATSWRLGNMFTAHWNPGARRPEPPRWPQVTIGENLLETRMVRLGDIDGDGDADVVGTATRSGYVLWLENAGRAAGVPWTIHFIDVVSRPAHGEIVDLDGDGDADVVMAAGFAHDLVPSEKFPIREEIAWHENLGAGRAWKKHLIDAKFSQAFEAITADLDGDGDRDVAATAWLAGGGVALAWYEAAGSGRWVKHEVRTNWPRAVQLVAADLDGDGRTDLAACAEGETHELRWWRNEGAATAQRASP